MLMTKEVLEQYVDLLKEIKKLDKRIERLEKQSTIVSDVVQNRIQKTRSNKRCRPVQDRKIK